MRPRLGLRLRSGRRPGHDLWPLSGERCGRENHLRLVGRFPAHVRLDLLGPHAGVLQLPEAPHHLDEVVSRVFAVGATGVRLAQVLAPVGALVALARQPQLGVLPLTGHDHGACVFVLGAESDGFVPDASPAFALGLR